MCFFYRECAYVRPSSKLWQMKRFAHCGATWERATQISGAGILWHLIPEVSDFALKTLVYMYKSAVRTYFVNTKEKFNASGKSKSFSPCLKVKDSFSKYGFCAYWLFIWSCQLLDQFLTIKEWLVIVTTVIKNVLALFLARPLYCDMGRYMDLVL